MAGLVQGAVTEGLSHCQKHRREIGKIYPDLSLLAPSDLLPVPSVGQTQPGVIIQGSSRGSPRGQPPASLSGACKRRPAAQEAWV